MAVVNLPPPPEADITVQLRKAVPPITTGLDSILTKDPICTGLDLAVVVPSPNRP